MYKEYNYCWLYSNAFMDKLQHMLMLHHTTTQKAQRISKTVQPQQIVYLQHVKIVKKRNITLAIAM